MTLMTLLTAIRFWKASVSQGLRGAASDVGRTGLV